MHGQLAVCYSHIFNRVPLWDTKEGIRDRELPQWSTATTRECPLPDLLRYLSTGVYYAFMFRDERTGLACWSGHLTAAGAQREPDQPNSTGLEQ